MATRPGMTCSGDVNRTYKPTALNMPKSTAQIKFADTHCYSVTKLRPGRVPIKTSVKSVSSLCAACSIHLSALQGTCCSQVLRRSMAPGTAKCNHRVNISKVEQEEEPGDMWLNTGCTISCFNFDPRKNTSTKKVRANWKRHSRFRACAA
jgi:hypothetical protein